MSLRQWFPSRIAFALGIFVCGLASLTAAHAAAPPQMHPETADSQIALTTNAVAPHRFIAAHGRRALVSGYASSGLEVWAYPFQILSSYRIAFRPQGATTPIPGEQILSRVTYTPSSIVRTYLGPDFVARETLFVPLNEPGAILTYSVESPHPVEIVVHATPVLDLMWPGGLGGQSAAWDNSLSAFVLTEPADGYSAIVGSPQIVAHDDLSNSAQEGDRAASLGFSLQTDGSGFGRVYVGLNPAHTSDPGALFRHLIRDRVALVSEAAAHIDKFRAQTLRIETPDPQVNQAITWAQIALDQAWVCNPDLGCGFVAGYGPSRGARRPQYDWFFAGDGLVAADAAIAGGDTARAREELEFILRYQNQKIGMIWHELSQSAALIDWQNKFPYMFVHVDITFQFISTVERYVTASGDAAFAREHWQALNAAYTYCRSLIDPATALPRIPSDKEGGDEQDRMADDLDLSTSWVEASHAFAHLAALTGHTELADEAEHASHLAGAAIPQRYWDQQHSFWVSGHTAAGEPAPEQRSGSDEALALRLFEPAQEAHILDTLASSAFQTDWGTRSVSAASPGYDASSYAKGSVWAVATASLATTFWSAHRPVTAFALWSALLPWTSLDSLGHMDEVLAGDLYRPQTESVPEQTWSSAGFLGATVHGLLGLKVDSLTRRIEFAPRLPATWSGVSVDHIVLGDAAIALALERTPHGLTLTIDNTGAPFQLTLAPQIPLGAALQSVVLDDRAAPHTVQADPQESVLNIPLQAPHGRCRVHMEWRGGVDVIAPASAPVLAMPGSAIHVIGVRLEKETLTIAADVPSNRESHLQLKTDWKVVDADGAVAQRGVDGLTQLTFIAAGDKAAPYRRASVVVHLRPE